MSEDCYTAIEIVKDYEGYLEDLFFSLPMEYSLEEMRYSMWAISELLEQLARCPLGDELPTMETLSNTLDTYIRLKTRNSRMFLIAHATVNNEIDLFYST